MKKIMFRLGIAVLIIAGLILLYRLTPLGDYLDPSRLAENRDRLIDFVRTRFAAAAVIYVGLYIASTALSVPGATVLSLLGGFFFGPWIGVLLINAGATAGALLVFFAARFIIGHTVQEQYGQRLARFNAELEENGRNYLLTLRLIPIFPFFLINLFAGVTTIPVLTFLWTTALGIIPGSFVYAYLGHTGANIEPGESLLSLQVLLALVLLGLLSLMPVIGKKLRARTTQQRSETEDGHRDA
jgi:uncharacterized membrane protein YdjX (TVP38/TMEM64 family)